MTLIFLILWLKPKWFTEPPGVHGRAQKIIDEIKNNGYCSSEYIKNTTNLKWNEIAEISFNALKCKMIVKTSKGDFEHHLYNDRFIGNYHECCQVIETFKEILNNYLPDEKRKWST